MTTREAAVQLDIKVAKLTELSKQLGMKHPFQYTYDHVILLDKLNKEINRHKEQVRQLQSSLKLIDKF